MSLPSAASLGTAISRNFTLDKYRANDPELLGDIRALQKMVENGQTTGTYFAAIINNCFARYGL
jgi:hypothetical protein